MIHGTILDFSWRLMFRLIPNYEGPRAPQAADDNDGLIPYGGDSNKLDGPPTNPNFRHAFRQAVLLNGIDMPGLGGWLTAAHTSKAIEQTVTAIAAAIEMLNAEGISA